MGGRSLVTERAQQIGADKISRSIFLRISSSENGGCFSISGRSTLEVEDCIFYECRTSRMGGCIYTDLSKLFVSKRNCFWRCVGETQTHTFRCTCPKSDVNLNTLCFCASIRVAAYGSYHILNSNALVSKVNCTSCQTEHHGPGGFLTKSSAQIDKQNIYNCTGMGVLVIKLCSDSTIDMINYFCNTQVQDGHLFFYQSAVLFVSNGVFFGNSRNNFIYGTAPYLSNCVFDTALQVSNTNCQFGVESPSTLHFGGVNQCTNKTKIFSVVSHLNIHFLFVILHLFISN